MFADAENIEADFIGEFGLCQQMLHALDGTEREAGRSIRDGCEGPIRQFTDEQRRNRIDDGCRSIRSRLLTSNFIPCEAGSSTLDVKLIFWLCQDLLAVSPWLTN